MKQGRQLLIVRDWIFDILAENKPQGFSRRISGNTTTNSPCRLFFAVKIKIKVKKNKNKNNRFDCFL